MNDMVYRSAEAVVAVETQYRRVLERWPVPKTELHVLTRQGSTFVVACGPESAPPVVLLHGSLAKLGRMGARCGVLVNEVQAVSDRHDR